jgi:hypothetical protein
LRWKDVILLVTLAIFSNGLVFFVNPVVIIHCLVRFVNSLANKISELINIFKVALMGLFDGWNERGMGLALAAWSFFRVLRKLVLKMEQNFLV